MINVPIEFKPIINTVYPHGNHQIFEHWFSLQNIPNTSREYLPIQWTAYFVNNQYGNDKEALNRLQQFVNNLPKNKQYYTIVQYDDGILVDVSGIDLLEFNMSKDKGVKIPLLCMPHDFKQSEDKNILASFIGNRTHPIRDNVFNINNNEYYISDKQHSENEFCDVVSRSLFSLCPRGYGLSSFRICESLQYETIPIYISDEFIIPFGLNFENFGVLIKEKDAHKIEEIISKMSLLSIVEKQNAIKNIYNRYYTYNGLFNEIINYLEG